MSDAIVAMRHAFTGESETPMRSSLGGSLVMPGRLDGHLAIKVVSAVPGNPVGIVVAFDSAGRPIGLVDGATLTAIRTGAVSGLATDLMATSKASTLAMLGAGAVGFDQVEAVRSVRPIETIRVWSRKLSNAERLADRVGGTAVSDPNEAVENADVICCATPATRPLFDERTVRSATHVNAVGAFRPEMAEVPKALLDRGYVVVDDLDAAAAEAGDLIQADRQPNATLREMLTDAHTAIGEDVTIFKSVGVAVQDVAAAVKALQNAERLGIGTKL